jgi:hypothetical protein
MAIKVTQTSVEVLDKGGGAAKASTIGVEVLANNTSAVPSQARVSGALVEVVTDHTNTPSEGKISSFGVEALTDHTNDLSEGKISVMGVEVLWGLGTGSGTTFYVPPDGTILTLDQAVSVTDDDIFLLINADGQVITTSVTQGGTAYEVVIPTPQSVVEGGATWAIISPDLDGQLYKVLSIKEESEELYTVIAIQHDEQKFAIIDAEQVFPALPTSIYSTDAIKPPTDLTITNWYETVSGTEAFPHITASWVKPDDARVTGFEFQLKTPTQDYTLRYDGPAVSWDSERLTSDSNNQYSGRVRAYDALGRYSSWVYYEGFNVEGNTSSPTPPTSVSVSNLINGYSVNWTNYTGLDFAYTEVWVGTTNVQASSSLVAQVPGTSYTDQSLTPGNVRYIWLRTVTHASTNNTSSYAGSYTATARAVGTSDVSSSLSARVVQIVLMDSPTTVTAATGVAYFPVPDVLDGLSLVEVVGSLITPSSSGTPTVQLKKATVAVPGSTNNMLSTALTFDVGEYTTLSAAVPTVIDATYKTVHTDDLIRVDITSAGTGAKGMIVTLKFN